MLLRAAINANFLNNRQSIIDLKDLINRSDSKFMFIDEKLNSKVLRKVQLKFEYQFIELNKRTINVVNVIDVYVFFL